MWQWTKFVDNVIFMSIGRKVKRSSTCLGDDAFLDITYLKNYSLLLLTLYAASCTLLSVQSFVHHDDPTLPLLRHE